MKGSVDAINEPSRKTIDEERKKSTIVEAEKMKKRKLQELARPKGTGCSKITVRTNFTQEESQVASILKNSKTRELLTGEEQLAFWANSQKQKVQDLRSNLETIKSEER